MIVVEICQGEKTDDNIAKQLCLLCQDLHSTRCSVFLAFWTALFKDGKELEVFCKLLMGY